MKTPLVEAAHYACALSGCWTPAAHSHVTVGERHVQHYCDQHYQALMAFLRGLALWVSRPLP